MYKSKNCSEWQEEHISNGRWTAAPSGLKVRIVLWHYCKSRPTAYSRIGLGLKAIMQNFSHRETKLSS